MSLVDKSLIKSLVCVRDASASLSGPASTEKSPHKRMLEEASRVLSKGFSLCINDRSGVPFESSKRRASLFIGGSLLRVYFRVRGGLEFWCYCF